MEANNVVIPPIPGGCILRSTDEDVEVIAFYQKNDGSRSTEDWVTYIDSRGTEHIKENLNIQLDFKSQANNMLEKLMETPSFKNMPTERNRRVFEASEELVKTGYCVDNAVSIATELVDKVGIETV